MIKMMVIVVIVFTICWLPYNSLLLACDSSEWLSDWAGLPYAWFLTHWLAMSHSCYNPVIYCWMNSRFRASFVCALERVPCLRGLLPDLQPHSRGPSSVMGIALAGLDTNDSTAALQRINTRTSYVSVRTKTSANSAPVEFC